MSRLATVRKVAFFYWNRMQRAVSESVREHALSVSRDGFVTEYHITPVSVNEFTFLFPAKTSTFCAVLSMQAVLLYAQA